MSPGYESAAEALTAAPVGKGVLDLELTHTQWLEGAQTLHMALQSIDNRTEVSPDELARLSRHQMAVLCGPCPPAPPPAPARIPAHRYSDRAYISEVMVDAAGVISVDSEPVSGTITVDDLDDFIDQLKLIRDYARKKSGWPSDPEDGVLP